MTNRSWIKEPFSGMSHAIGALLSVVGLVLLLATAGGQAYRIVAFSVYGGSLILLYTMSALYHSLHLDDGKVVWFQRFDHIGIYLLIAGTYAPICLIPLRGAIGPVLLAVVYAIAVAGVLVTLLWRTAPHWVRVVFYIVMGWLAALAISPLKAAVTSAGIWWLVAGGLFYSLGIVFYATNKPRISKGIAGHELWHLFVLAGSLCHYILILDFVAPIGM